MEQLTNDVQQGLGEMRLLLEQAERGMVKTNHKANSMEAELNTLRCQVLTLRYQLDAVDATDLADGSQLEQVILVVDLVFTMTKFIVQCTVHNVCLDF